MDRFRVFSDLHLDYNKDFEISIPDDGVFSVCAGDISGEMRFCHVGCPNGDCAVVVDNDEAILDLVGNGTLFAECRFSGKGRKFGLAVDGKVLTEEALGIHVVNKPALKSGDRITLRAVEVRKWIKENLRKGVFVAGNHLVYNHIGMTVEELKKGCAHDFYEASDVTFLDATAGVMTKEVDGILFVGTTLYTDYRLPVGNYITEDDIVKYNMYLANPMFGGGGMNDFRFGRVKTTHDDTLLADEDGKYYLSPKDYRAWFDLSIKRMTRIVEENKDRDIVVVTHHCPSRKCISSEYVGNDMNASYVSDLDGFIASHPQIRCWVCGHVHHRDSFRIGDCRVVMNPLGYCRHGQFLKNGWDWTPNVFVDTKTWEVSVEPFDNSGFMARYERYEKARSLLRFSGNGFF